MTKRQLIDEIIAINPTATPRFLAQFPDDDLDQYLTHLRVLSAPRLAGEPGRYEKYFRNCPTIRYTRPQWRPTMLADPPDPDQPQPVEDLHDPAATAAEHEPDSEPLAFADNDGQPYDDQSYDDPSPPDARAEEALIELAAFIPDAVEQDDEDADEDETAPRDDPDALQLSAADDQTPAEAADDDDADADTQDADEPAEQPLAQASRPLAPPPARADRRKTTAAPLFADNQEDSDTWLY